LVDSAYGRLVADVARGRRVDPSRVRTGFGEGRLLPADAALRAGLVDQVVTLDEMLGRLDGTAGRAALDSHRQALARAELAARRHDLAAVARRHGIQ
jgi:ClpP class serine protease